MYCGKRTAKCVRRQGEYVDTLEQEIKKYQLIVKQQQLALEEYGKQREYIDTLEKEMKKYQLIVEQQEAALNKYEKWCEIYKEIKIKYYLNGREGTNTCR